MDNYSAMEAKIKVLESQIEYLKCVAQLKEDYLEAQIALLNEKINALNNKNSGVPDYDKTNKAAEKVYGFIKELQSDNPHPG